MENEIMTAETVETAVYHEQKAAPSVIDGMSRAYKLGQVMCTADIVPATYKNKPADCMIAIDMAERMGVNPLVVMQNMYVVKGKPSWSGQACKMLIDNCGKFTDVHHVYIGEKGTDERGCYVVGTRISSGEIVEGATVTIGMAKAEGWTSNSKWKNMPEIMLAYRSAAFFARVHCPEALMGVHTEEENEDIGTGSSNAKNLTDKLKGLK